jgi:hypothetical protein
LKTVQALLAWILMLAATSLPADEPQPISNDAAGIVIRKAVGQSEIVITTTPRLAGAIHSLTWNGREFIDSADHGRQLQSASAFDKGTAWSNSEEFNPTEAGSVRDGDQQTSTSRLLHKVTGPDFLQTTIQMSYWLPPEGMSGGKPAKNKTALSNHLLTKRVQIGYMNLPNVIDYRVTFSVPAGERHTRAQFEALTGYMPAEFHKFYAVVPDKTELQPLDPGPGEQPHPVIAANEAGTHAMGIWTPTAQPVGFTRVGYGRFVFEKEKVTKWNCVFRKVIEKDAAGESIPLAAGEYSFQMFVIVGDLNTVHKSMLALQKTFLNKNAAPFSHK